MKRFFYGKKLGFEICTSIKYYNSFETKYPV